MSGDPGGGGSVAPDPEDVASYGQDDDLDEVVLESSKTRLVAAAAALAAASSPPPPGSIIWTTMGSTVGWKLKKKPCELIFIDSNCFRIALNISIIFK